MWGISFSGGGQKGFAHLGVIKGVEEDKIHIQSLSGSSIGAIMASALAVGISYAELEEFVLRLKTRDIIDIRPNITSALAVYFRLLLGRFQINDTTSWSLLNGDKITKLLKEIFGKIKINEVSKPLAITAVDINKGKDVIFTNRPNSFDNFPGIVIDDIPLYLAIRASIAIPLVYKGVIYKEFHFIDGGLTNNIPVYLIKKLGCKEMLSVVVTKTPPYEEKPNSIIDVGGRLINIAVDNSRYVTNPDVVIEPVVPEVSLGDLDKSMVLIEAGYESYKKARKIIFEKKLNFFEKK